MGAGQSMHQINVNGSVYEEARRRAEAAGFASVDEYVADLLSNDFEVVEENLDHFFTPERLALIDEAAADVAAGNVYRLEQAREIHTAQDWQSAAKDLPAEP